MIICGKASIAELLRVRMTAKPWLILVPSPISYFVSSMQRITQSTEVCYLFRYMALNGRNTGSPWSLRQCGVYQHIDAPNKRAIWILIQPEPALLNDFFAAIARENEFSLRSCLEPHLIMLDAATQNWKQFAAHLRKTLYSIVS